MLKRNASKLLRTLYTRLHLSGAQGVTQQLLRPKRYLVAPKKTFWANSNLTLNSRILQICQQDFKYSSQPRQNYDARLIEWDANLARSKEYSGMENREQETVELMNIIVTNCKARIDFNNNDYCLRLPCSSQMLGSGKTHFGRAFLANAKTPYFMNKWIKEYPNDMDIVNSVLNALYITVDLRESVLLTAQSIEQRKNAVVERIFHMLCNFAVAEDPAYHQKIQDMCPRLKEPLSIGQIIIEFQRMLGKLIFVHIDEVDSLVFLGRNLDKETIMHDYYYLWINLFHPINQNGICYVSGRSPYLYLAGQQSAKDRRLRYVAPSGMHHIFFDRLLLNNIKNIIKTSYPELYTKDKTTKLTDEEVHQLAVKINFWSAGVPRFVKVSLDYYKQKGGNICPLLENEETEWKNIHNFFLQARGLVAELQQYEALNDQEKKLYMRYAGDALLGVPHILRHSEVRSMTNTLTRLWQLGIYTAKTPQTELEKDTTVLGTPNLQQEYIYPLFPYAVAYHLQRINAWPKAFADPATELQDKSIFQSTGIILENLLVENMVYRITKVLRSKIFGTNPHGNVDIDHHFPFLQNSAIASKKFVRPLPHTNDHVWKCSKEETNTNGRVEAIAKYFGLEWTELLPHLHTRLHTFGPKSYSGDVYYFWVNADRTVDMLVFQCKSGKQALELKDIEEEAKKIVDTSLYEKPVSNQQRGLGKVVYVVVGGLVSQDVSKFAIMDSNGYAWKVLPQKDSILGNAQLETYLLTKKGQILLLSGLNLHPAELA